MNNFHAKRSVPNVCQTDHLAQKRTIQTRAPKLKVLSSFTFTIQNTVFEIENEDEELNTILKGENPYSASLEEPDEVSSWHRNIWTWSLSSPHAYASQRASGSSWSWPFTANGSRAATSSRCDTFRRDNAKSICPLVHDEIMGELFECMVEEEAQSIRISSETIAFGANELRKDCLQHDERLLRYGTVCPRRTFSWALVALSRLRGRAAVADKFTPSCSRRTYV